MLRKLKRLKNQKLNNINQRIERKKNYDRNKINRKENYSKGLRKQI